MGEGIQEIVVYTLWRGTYYLYLQIHAQDNFKMILVLTETTYSGYYLSGMFLETKILFSIYN